MYAAGSGNVPMAEMLLEKGDDVDKTDVRGRTALAYAAKTAMRKSSGLSAITARISIWRTKTASSRWFMRLSRETPRLLTC